MSMFDWGYFKTQWRNRNYFSAFKELIRGLWEDFIGWLLNRERWGL